MKKIEKHCKLGESYNADYKELDRIFNKVNEIVEWINNYNKQWVKFWLEVTESPEFEKLKKRVDKLEQARGEPDPDRKSKYIRKVTRNVDK